MELGDDAKAFRKVLRTLRKAHRKSQQALWAKLLTTNYISTRTNSGTGKTVEPYPRILSWIDSPSLGSNRIPRGRAP